MVVDAAGNVRERNDYYAFGKRWEDPEQPISDNRYLYNGKEKQVTGNIGYSDYGARMNDDLIGRWFIPDPLAEDYFETSPYVFCANNPIRYIDKVGTKIVDVSGNILYQDGKWTKYADGTDAMLIGSTMLQTPTGTDIWERMAESSTRILFEIKSELSYGKKGGLALGVATHKSFSNYVKITLFEGSINEYIRLDKIFNDSEKQELMRNSTRQERLTGVAVHEGTHALDRIFDDKRELRANQNEIKYLKEVEKNRPIIEDEDLNRTINKFLRTN